MAKLAFTPEDLRHGFALAKLVQPEKKDYILKFVNGYLSIYSAGKRSFVRSEVKPIKSDTENFTSDDYYLPMDRRALFETDLTSVSLIVNEKGMTIKAEGDGQTRTASVKKRPDNSRRPEMPVSITISGTEMDPKNLEELLHQVSCSALVKSTKTEEEMRINQVHFYPDKFAAFSSARTYASIVTLDPLPLSISIVAADLPAMRAFCSRCKGKVIVSQDRTHMLLQDPNTGSHIAFTRVASNKPAFSSYSPDDFSYVISVDKEQFTKSINWSSMAIEMTSRLSLRSIPDSDTLVMSSGKKELSTLPVKFHKGESFAADFPVDSIANIVPYLNDGRVMLKYGHKSQSCLLEICNEEMNTAVKSRHFVLSMPER